LNTALSPCISGVVGYSVVMLCRMPFMTKFCEATHFKPHLFSTMINTVLAGAVAVTGPCAFMDNTQASIIGGFAALGYFAADFLSANVLGIEDPMRAFAVHGGGGVIGILAGAFGNEKTIAIAYSKAVDSDNKLLRTVGHQFANQILGLVVIAMVSGLGTGCVFYFLKRYNLLRSNEPTKYQRHEWEQELFGELDPGTHNLIYETKSQRSEYEYDDVNDNNLAPSLVKSYNTFIN